MTNKPTVYVTREIPAPGLEQLKESYDVEVWSEKRPPSKEQIIDRLSELEADGLVCLLTDDIDATVMDASSNLEVISTYSVGYDHVDLAAATERDIAVGHTPGVLTETTADFTWSLLATCARRTVEGYEYVRDDKWETWQPELLTGPDIHGATLGIVGLGNIGNAVAKRAAGFDMTVLYSDVQQREEAEQQLAESGVDITHVDQEKVFRQSDFVSVHVPLFEATRGLVGEEELRSMKESAILINTSRGPVVETASLIKALDQDWIERAGLDVTDPEPLPADHELLEYAPEKLVVTPHLASASIETRQKMAEMAAENAIAGLQSNPLPNSAIEDDH
ncbi:2-hydroxyacid dehydrogenase [Haloarcula amylovorans]|uniref:2-hydroxyacid dehydrogenase n=1 Tax=Haloarcula amylovorans TaxID=2562280 RepID=UPI001076699E|nr:D-glycerate dehydrogenase [Halomicroarcula amylolytica]